MLYRCITLSLLITILFPSLSLAKDGNSGPIKLYLAIESNKKALDQVSKIRYQRMLLKKIIELGKHEFQIFDKKDLSEISISGELLKIAFRPSSKSNVKLSYSLKTYDSGKEVDSKDKELILNRNQIFSLGISKIISLLEHKE